MKKEDKMRISIFIFIYRTHLAYLKVYTKCVKTLAPIGAEKSMTEFSLERKNYEQIKGLINNMRLFLLTIQLITIKRCTKFQNPKSSSCRENFDRKKFTERQT